MPLNRLGYSKPWLSFADQLALLRSRGLIIADVGQAEKFLAHINYYRLSGYCLAFESARHSFVAGTTFEQLVAAYEFDSCLRRLIAQAVAIVEIDIRTAVAHHFGRQYGAFGHAGPANFYSGSINHAQWLNKLHGEAQRSSEQFVKHFQGKYSEFPDLPVWVITEIMSFGSLSLMYGGMKKADQKLIARQYGLQSHIMESWLHHLVYIRNICAHHSRFWDKVWAIKPKLPAGQNWQPPLFNNNNRIFTTLVILKYLLARIPVMAEHATGWKRQVDILLGELPAVANAGQLLGLEEDWQGHPLWV